MGMRDSYFPVSAQTLKSLTLHDPVPSARTIFASSREIPQAKR